MHNGQEDPLYLSQLKHNTVAFIWREMYRKIDDALLSAGSGWIFADFCAVLSIQVNSYVNNLF
jgi:hypothetical protein